MFGAYLAFLAHLEVTWGDMYFYFYFFCVKEYFIYGLQGEMTQEA